HELGARAEIAAVCGALLELCESEADGSWKKEAFRLRSCLLQTRHYLCDEPARNELAKRQHEDARRASDQNALVAVASQYAHWLLMGGEGLAAGEIIHQYRSVVVQSAVRADTRAYFAIVDAWQKVRVGRRFEIKDAWLSTVGAATFLRLYCHL